jgi:hypothetical protein
MDEGLGCTESKWQMRIQKSCGGRLRPLRLGLPLTTSLPLVAYHEIALEVGNYASSGLAVCHELVVSARAKVLRKFAKPATRTVASAPKELTIRHSCTCETDATNLFNSGLWLFSQLHSRQERGTSILRSQSDRQGQCSDFSKDGSPLRICSFDHSK